MHVCLVGEHITSHAHCHWTYMAWEPIGWSGPKRVYYTIMYKLLWFLLLLKGCRLPPTPPSLGKTCKPWSKQIIFLLFFSSSFLWLQYWFIFYFWISILIYKNAQQQWPRTPVKKMDSEDKKRMCRISHPMWAHCISWTEIISSLRFHLNKWLIDTVTRPLKEAFHASKIVILD